MENENTLFWGIEQFSNARLWYLILLKEIRVMERKKVFCVNTMGFFSGDGTVVQQDSKEVWGRNPCGLQIKMPNSVCDSKLLKKGIEENRQMLGCRQADRADENR